MSAKKKLPNLSANDANTLLDVVYEEHVAQAKRGKYYKFSAMKEAYQALESYEYLLKAQTLLELPFVDSVELEMEEDYNDEGDTYMTVYTNIGYKDEDGHEGEVRFYSGCDDVEEGDDDDFSEIVKNSNTQNVITSFLEHINHLDESLLQSTEFFNTKWAKDTIMGIYQKNYPVAYSAIEKHFIAQSIPDKSRKTSGAHKI